MSINCFVFDIETVPDVSSGRKIHRLDDDLKDKDVAEIMLQKRRQQTQGSEFLQLHLHRIVAISVLFRSGSNIKCWSLGQTDSSEAELVQRFFDGIEKYSPVLVSWNGGGFDLPVLHYRALLHGVVARTYWDVGDQDREFKWNNYLSRYHWRHIDVMDIIALFNMRAVAPLDQIACMLGFPGKLGMDGSQVWQSYLDQDIDGIRQYCETDVLNTYLIYLRFELIRGKLIKADYQIECQRVRDMLAQSNDKPHWQQFLQAWPE